MTGKKEWLTILHFDLIVRQFSPFISKAAQVLYTRAPFRARINLSHFGADINYLIYLVKLFSKPDDNSGWGKKTTCAMAPF